MSVQAISWAFDQDLKPCEKMILLALANYANDSKLAWPSYQTLSKKTGIKSETTISNHLKTLESLGLIMRIRRGRKLTSIYRLNFEVLTKTVKPDANEVESELQNLGSELQNLEGELQNLGADTKEYTKERTVLNNICAPPPGDAPPSKNQSGLERFDEWWTQYPVKRNKKKAKELWQKRKLDKQADQIIADTIKRRTSDANWLAGYIPLPTTYINGDRWDDDYGRPQQTQHRGNSAFDRVMRNIEEAEAERQRNGSAMGDHDPDVREPMDFELWGEDRPDGGLGSVYEGDYTRHD